MVNDETISEVMRHIGRKGVETQLKTRDFKAFSRMGIEARKKKRESVKQQNQS